MKKNILKKNILILIPLALSSMAQEAVAQTTSGAGVVCTPYVVNGQSTMRCVGGTGPARQRPPAVTLPPLNGEVPIITPPPPPPAPVITNPGPVVGVNPIDTTGGPSAPNPGMRMCENPGERRSPGLGPGPCGSVEIPIGTCSHGMTGSNAIVKAWQFNLEDGLSLRKGNTLRFGLEPNHAIVFRFKTGPEVNTNYGFAMDEYIPHGNIVPKFMAISENRCDFDYNKLYSEGSVNVNQLQPDANCYVAGSIGSRWGLTSTDPTYPARAFPRCPMKPNTVYYLSMRWEDARPNYYRADGVYAGGTPGVISCSPAHVNSVGTCGILLGFQ